MTTIVSTVNNNNIAPILIEDPNDIRVNIFHNLKDSKATIRDGMFIAEGPETIRLLLNNTLFMHKYIHVHRIMYYQDLG